MLMLGDPTDNRKYLRDEVALIETNNPKSRTCRFTLPHDTDLDMITDFMFTGNNEDQEQIDQLRQTIK